LQFIDTLDFATVESKVNSLGESIDDVDASSTDNAQSQLEAIGTSAETAESKVHDLQTTINGLTGKTVTVSVDVKRKNSLLSMLGFAKGTKNAPDGAALTGEEGAELIKSGDQAYLAGANGPEIVHLNQGDTVYTAEETKDILKSGKYLSGSIPAYSNGYKGGASGTVNPRKTYKPVLPSSMSSKGTSTASEIKEAAEATKSLEEQLEDTLKGMKETIDDIIGDYEHSIMILEHKKADPNEIINIYKQMQEAVHQQAEEYRALGLDENSDYIQDLQKQWWEYQDSIQDLIIETYEKSVAEHENAITLNENWLDKAITKKDFSGITKYTSDIISHYKAMQEEIHQQAEYYRSLGYSDTSDEVSKLSDL
ncbi:MAG: coiled-coil domain-containing protein 22, partial [Lachnospiraceae bacterium]|nr:coiled-coil domain-containing protein 22 [Lachnospiraceae bacterium]